MKTTLGIIFGTLLLSSSAFAERARPTGPDFIEATPRRHIDRALVASPDGTSIIEPHDIVAFKLDSASLTEGGVSQVESAARWLKRHPGYRIVLEGHTDRIGLAPYNEDLATQRIATVRNALAKHGVASDRMIMITYGEREAIAPENPNDRRVVMFATALSPQAVVAMTREQREAIVATWTERGALMQMQHGLKTPTVRTVTGRR